MFFKNINLKNVNKVNTTYYLIYSNNIPVF